MGLLDQNANVHASDKANRTALVFASSNGHVNIVKTLLDRNANIEDAAKKWQNIAAPRRLS